MSYRKKVVRSINEGLQQSSVPLKQSKFPSPNKRIRTYATKASKSIPKLQAQDTLTQIWDRDVPSDEDWHRENGVADEADEFAATGQLAKPKRRRKTLGDMAGDEADHEGYMQGCTSQRRKRRRVKGIDDDPNQDALKRVRKGRRKTLGDTPSPDSQQTLTQIVRSSMESLEDGMGEDPSIYDVPSSSQIPPSIRSRRATIEPKIAAEAESKRVPHSMGPPQTPHRRKFPLEIPSSESPATPGSFHTRLANPSLADYSPSLRRTPLTDKSINAPIPFSTTINSSAIKLPKLPPRLEVRDTFDTEESQQTRIPTTPSKRSSPAKSVRFFGIPDDIGEEEEHEKQEKQEEQEYRGEEAGIDTSEDVFPTLRQEQFKSTPRPLNQTAVKGEIADSDAESDSDDGGDNPIIQDEDNQDESEPVPASIEKEEIADDLEPETCYGEFPTSTQLLTVMQSSEKRAHREASQELGEASYSDIKSQFKSQYESQRLSTQHVNEMAPRTSDSDVFISIHPSQIKNIVNRTKDHEFRKWGLLPNTIRIWFYETAPKSRVKYMATISSAKRPGKDSLDDQGLGNAEFNARPDGSSEYAYEILDLYELANPVSFAEIKQKGWFKTPPQKYVFVRPVPLDELMANLLPPIFTRYDIPDDLPVSSPSTDSQEAEAQLASNIRQFTQVHSNPPSSNLPEPKLELEERIIDSLPPSSHPAPNSPDPPQAVRPSQAETVDLTQPPSRSQPHSPDRQSLPDIIWESPTRPVPPSTPGLPTPRPMERHSSGSIAIPFSFASSQLLTKSQMLPESLLHDSIPAPPRWVRDSDDEEF